MVHFPASHVCTMVPILKNKPATQNPMGFWHLPKYFWDAASLEDIYKTKWTVIKTLTWQCHEIRVGSIPSLKPENKPSQKKAIVLVNPYIQQTTRSPLITAQSLELSSTWDVLNISKLAGCSHEHARRFIDPQHCIGNLISMEKHVLWRTVGDAMETGLPGVFQMILQDQHGLEKTSLGSSFIPQKNTQFWAEYHILRFACLMPGKRSKHILPNGGVMINDDLPK